MTYRIADLTFVKVDEDGVREKDNQGNVITYVPRGRWKELEYLCEDRSDDEFIIFEKAKELKDE